jgi:choline dehydrogenase-like flavoprotein
MSSDAAASLPRPSRSVHWTQSHQFLDAPTRGRHAAVIVGLSSYALLGRIDRWLEADALREKLESRIYRRMLVLTGESPPSENKYVTLSEERDRFGDAFAHVHPELHELDFATFEFMSAVHDRIVDATGATESNWSPDPRLYASGAHHMGGTRMGVDPAQSVVDPWGRAHGVPGVYVAGGSTFPGSSGAMNPTLTMVALAFRTSDRIVAELEEGA